MYSMQWKAGEEPGNKVSDLFRSDYKQLVTRGQIFWDRQVLWNAVCHKNRVVLHVNLREIPHLLFSKWGGCPPSQH